MTIRPNPDRARLLRARGYTISEIADHMNEEGRDVHPAEVTAWLKWATPPQMYEFRGVRRPLSEIAKIAKVDPTLLRQRVERGMSVPDAISRRVLMPAESARCAASPWRSLPSCAGGAR